MRKIISISRRTDIPAFYIGWLKEALLKEEVDVYWRGKKHRVSLKPDDVHTLVFWSKNYGEFINDMDLNRILQNYNVFFHFTITGLGATKLEPKVEPWASSVKQIVELADIWGAERIQWRFDPIIFWKDNDKIMSNIGFFEQFAGDISDSGIKKCIFSFATLYNKIFKRTNKYGLELVDPNLESKLQAISSLKASASRFGIKLTSCSQPQWNQLLGIEESCCIDGMLLKQLHNDMILPSIRKDKTQRADCMCNESIDIGSYTQKCQHACLYCYANPCYQSFNFEGGGEKIV